MLAKVDGQTITARQVERELDALLKDRPTDPGARESLRGHTLAQLIKRHLILQYLARNKSGASPEDVDLAVRRIVKQLQQQKLTLAEYLKRSGQTEGELRHTLAWQLGWQRFIERYLTDQNLERYFGQHRRDFDGTELRVAHVLFAVAPRGDRAATDKAAARARDVLAQIQTGTLSFADAARQHSAAPTGPGGGDIGFIARRQPMPESFSRAAFALERGQTSAPVVSPFGVHLIQCLEIKPGSQTWEQTRGELERAVTEYLFHWAAGQQYPRSSVELSAGAPLCEFRPDPPAPP